MFQEFMIVASAVYITNMLYFVARIMLAISFWDLIAKSFHLGSILV